VSLTLNSQLSLHLYSNTTTGRFSLSLWSHILSNVLFANQKHCCSRAWLPYQNFFVSRSQQNATIKSTSDIDRPSIMATHSSSSSYSVATNNTITPVGNMLYMRPLLFDQIILSALLDLHSFWKHFGPCSLPCHILSCLAFMLLRKCFFLGLVHASCTFEKENASITIFLFYFIFFHKRKNLVDTLAAKGHPLNDFEIVSYYEKWQVVCLGCLKRV